MTALPSLPRRLLHSPRALFAVVAVLGLVAGSLTFSGVASAGGDTVTICHSTGSSGNPYVTNHPSASGDVGGHDGHNGPIWTPTLVGTWGDIIPPFHYGGVPGADYLGKNWTTNGQEIWANKCGIVNPDLRLLKTSSGADVAGGTGSYFLNVKNIGTGTGTGPLTVTDTFPDGVVATLASGTNWTCTLGAAGASISCDFGGNLAPNASAPTITVSVNWVTSGSKVNSAHVTELAGDPTQNNTGSNTTVISPAPPVLTPDLRLLKTSSDDTVEGDTGSYSLDLKNIGTGSATGPFTVTDTFPLGVVGTAVSGTSWTCDPIGAGASISCVYSGNLAANASAPTITVTVNWVTVGTKVNSAHVTELVGEPTANNTGEATTVISAAPPVLTPDLRLLKTSSGPANEGTTGSYSLDLSNIGTGLATGPFTVTDTMPAGVVATDAAGTDWTCDPVGVGSSISCDFDGDLATGDSAPTITVSVNWVTYGSKVNSAHVTELNGEPTVNNTASNTTAIAEVPTAVVIKTNDANGDHEFGPIEDSPSVGAPVTFRLHVTNTSSFPINVSSVVSDAISTGTNESAPVTVSCLSLSDSALVLGFHESGDCFFTIEGYSPADGATTTDQATVSLTRNFSEQSLRRVAVRIAAPQFTAVSGTSTVRTKVPVRVTPPVTAPDLSIVKTGPASAVTPGSTVAYTLVVTNIGNAVATSGPVTDDLPAALTFVSAGGTGFACTGTSHIVCNLTGSLAPGASATINVVTTLASNYASTTLSNVAVVGPPDATPANNTSTAVTAVTLPGPPPDENLGVSKTGPGSAKPGDELVYTIDVTNVKGTPATGFTVTDVLPIGLAYSLATGTDFTCGIAGQTITCIYNGTLAVGQKATIAVRALLDSTFTGKTVGNTAVVDPRRADTDATDNSSTATTTVTPLPLSGGGGGAAEAPSPSPSPAAGGGEGGAGLPFTGSSSASWFQAGVSFLVLGLFLGLVGRRRRTASE